jgi:type I restriction enzyme S subunit
MAVEKTIENMSNIPKLRFPGFDGEWEVQKLGDVASKINSGKTPLGGESVYTNSGILFIRSQNVTDNKLSLENSTFIPEEINATMKNSVVLPNDILLNITGASLGRSCVVPEHFTKGNVNQHVCIIRLDKKYNPRFVQPILSSTKGQNIFTSLQTGSGREGLNFESIKGIEIAFPTLHEQERIAGFLSAVDEKISQLKEKKALLEAYKKGVMQQLFSRELRFKDADGQDYPDWEERKLGEVFYSEKGKGISKNKIVDNGIYECVLYGELYTRYKEVIFDIVSKTNEDDGLMSKEGDLLIPSSTTTTGIDLANITALNKSNVRLGGDITVLRSNEKISNIFYAYYLTNYKKDEIASYAQGSTIVHLYFSHIKEMNIHLPTLPEQVRIASFLSDLDERIGQVGQSLSMLEAWKRGLLQGLFV